MRPDAACGSFHRTPPWQAKLADAAVRETIARASETPLASSVATALRTPRRLAESTLGALPLPGPLRSTLAAALTPVNVLDDLAALVPSLATRNITDERSIEAFGKLWESATAAPAEAAEGAAGDAARHGGGTSAVGASSSSSASAGAADAASNGGVLPTGLSLPTVPELPELPSMPVFPPALVSAAQENAGPLLEQLGNPSSRLRQRLPALNTLSRRFGATLLRRVATRLEEDAARPGAPPLAREVASRAAAAERSIATLLEPGTEPAEPASTV